LRQRRIELRDSLDRQVGVPASVWWPPARSDRQRRAMIDALHVRATGERGADDDRRLRRGTVVISHLALVLELKPEQHREHRPPGTRIVRQGAA
jgi:hypothetical protein